MLISILTGVIVTMLLGASSPFLIPGAFGKIKKVVKDRDRLASIKRILKSGDNARKVHGKKRDAYKKMLVAATADNSTNRAELDALFAAASEAARIGEADYVRERTELVQHLSKDEFDAVLDPKTKTSEKNKKVVDKSIRKTKTALRKEAAVLRKSIRARVADSTSRKSALAAVESFEDTMQRSLDRLGKLNFEDNEVLRNYGASKSDLQTLFDGRNADRRDLADAFIELYLQMAAATSDDEWKKVSKELDSVVR